MALPLLKKLALLVSQAGEPRPQVCITTNGTLLTRQVRDWLVGEAWNVTISLDGPETIQDRWRLLPDGRGTFSRIEEAVSDLAERMRAHQFNVTAVLCRDTDPAEAFDAIAALGVRRTEMVPVAHRASWALPTVEDVVAYERFVMMHARRYCETDGWENIPTLAQLTRYIYRLMGYNLCRVSCGAGRTFVAVGPDGSLYPCFRFVGIRQYQIGQLPAGIDPERAMAFRRGPGRPYEERAACHACWAAPLCSGPCFACAELFGPGNGEPLSLHCTYRLADARAAVWLVGQLRRRDPDRLLAFLPGDVTEELP